MKHFKIIKKIPAEHRERERERVRNQGTRENSAIGNCIRTSESSTVKVHNVYHGKQHYIYKKL
jgi:hypothetical protein